MFYQPKVFCFPEPYGVHLIFDTRYIFSMLYKESRVGSITHCAPTTQRVDKESLVGTACHSAHLVPGVCGVFPPVKMVWSY